MKTIHHKKTIILVPATILFILMCGVYGGLYWYIHHIETRATALLNSIVVEDEKSFNNHALVNVIGEIDPIYTTLRSYGIYTDGVVSFINTVENLQKKTGAKIQISSLIIPEKSAASEEGGGPSSTPLTAAVDISGSWSSMLQTLELFENLPYMTMLDRVRVYKSGKEWGTQFEVKVLRVQ